MRETLRKLFLFENVSDEVLDVIENSCQIRSFTRGNIIFYEGDTSQYLYLVLAGKVKIYKTQANNNELVLKYFREGESIAEVAVFDGFAYPASAEALDDVRVLQVDFHAVQDLFLENANILLQVNQSLIKKIKNLESLLSRYLILDAKSRVIEYIVDNTEEFFSLKQHEVATLLNISPETLSRILKPFKADGIIMVEESQVDTKRLLLYKT